LVYLKLLGRLTLLLHEISGRAEDYLRSIHRIIELKGFARVKDVASDLKVKPSSVVEMMNKLQTMDLVIYEKYGGIRLTGEGMVIAQVVRKRHETFTKFLEIILVPREIALKDAHILEHQLDPKTILQFARFVEFMTDLSNKSGFIRRWAEEFKEYCSKEDKKASEVS
jgi:DtxR family Mn-dependent transcriptional regulator